MNLDEAKKHLEENGGFEYFRYVRFVDNSFVFGLSDFSTTHISLACSVLETKPGLHVKSSAYVSVKPNGIQVRDSSSSLKCGPAIEDESLLSEMFEKPILPRY